MGNWQVNTCISLRHAAQEYIHPHALTQSAMDLTTVTGSLTSGNLIELSILD